MAVATSLLAVVITLATLACTQGDGTVDRDSPADAGPGGNATTLTGSQTDSATQTPPAPAASLEPPPDTGSAAAAVAAIREYYRAIAAGEYDIAYRQWSDNGRASNQTEEEFRAGFARTAAVAVTIGEPGPIEGAAGSRYIEIPVAVSARTTDGQRQCFRGSYTLRRAVVPGATADQRRWRIASADLRSSDPAECAPSRVLSAAADSAAADSAAAVLDAFGRALANVSTTAPAEVVRPAIRQHYGAYVTSGLLQRWDQDPSSAPGREVSSPWPDRIEIRAAERTGDSEFRFTGEVVYVTSAELATGGDAGRRTIQASVVRQPEGWRINAVRISTP